MTSSVSRQAGLAMTPRLLALIVVGLAMCFSPRADAQDIDDVVFEYRAMYIGRAYLGDETVPLDLLRQWVSAEVGVGDFGLGLVLQHSDRLSGDLGNAETGLMATLRYGTVLTDVLRLETLGRVGFTIAESDFSQPLFATDTDGRASLVLFDPVGLPTAIGKLFFSGHGGAIVNFVGRVQLLGGAGVWWQDWGLYVTAFSAVNGVDDPFAPGDDEDVAFVKLNNAGIDVALSRDITFGEDRTVTVGLRQNFPLRNGGLNTTLSIQLRWGFFEAEPAAW